MQNVSWKVKAQNGQLVLNSFSLIDFFGLPPHTPTAPARDPTCRCGQSAREADGEGAAQDEEDWSKGGPEQRRHSRRLRHTDRKEAHSHSDRSTWAKGVKEKTKSFQEAEDEDGTQVAGWTGWSWAWKTYCCHQWVLSRENMLMCSQVWNPILQVLFLFGH